MAKKVAVAFIHGIGELDGDYRNQAKLKKQIEDKLEDEVKEDTAIHLIDWAKTFQHREEELKIYSEKYSLYQFKDMRPFMLSFLGDTISYQISPHDRQSGGYVNVHTILAQAMHNLAEECAGDAPLIVVSHSLGTVIASNYFYDLQHDYQYELGEEDDLDCKYVRKAHNLITDVVKREIDRTDSPLERGETLSYFFTLASPLAMYNMVYHKPRPDGYGQPILVPAPCLQEHHPKLTKEIEDKKKKSFSKGGEKAWVNYFHKKDIISFPLAKLNKCYAREVEDREVKISGWTSWTPLVHNEYSRDAHISTAIASKIEELWRLGYQK